MDLGEEYVHVSRQQCTLYVEADSVHIESLSKRNPTCVQPAGCTEWTWLRPSNGRHVLAIGSSIALDSRQLEYSRFILVQAAAPAVSAWSCPLCTYDNDEAVNSCAMCEAPRASAKRACTGISLRDRVGDDMRIRWDPRSTSEPLDEWITATLPSQVSGDLAAWIQVSNATVGSPGFVEQQVAAAFDFTPYSKELAKVEAIIARNERVPAEAKRACVQTLLSLAQEQRYTTGKWMLFFAPDEADAAWETIARATAQGELGCSAKIAPTADLPLTERAVCCVYVHDFADRAEVQRVLRVLQGLDMKVTSGFKPDVYTELNIMRNNPWRLEPTIYKVVEALEWPDGIARATYPKVRSSPWG